MREACIAKISVLGSSAGTSLGAGGQMLDSSKLRLTKPSLVELGLGLSLAQREVDKAMVMKRRKLDQGVATYQRAVPSPDPVEQEPDIDLAFWLCHTIN